MKNKKYMIDFEKMFEEGEVLPKVEVIEELLKTAIQNSKYEEDFYKIKNKIKI